MEEDRKFSGRPPRLSRVFDQTPLYFVTFNTWNRQPLLANDVVHDAFSSYAEKNRCRGFALGRYVLMPDHIHFFVRVGIECRLDQYIRLMKQGLTKVIKGEECSGGSANRAGEKQEAVHRTATTSEKIWQPGFFDHVMRSSESYSEKWNYVRMNPVRAGLVSNSNDWKYQGEQVKIFCD